MQKETVSVDKNEQRRIFSARLKDILVLRSLTQAELLRRANDWLPEGMTFSKQFMHMLVHSLSMPGPAKMLALCSALDVKPSDLDPTTDGLRLDSIYETLRSSKTAKLSRDDLEKHLEKVEPAPVVAKREVGEASVPATPKPIQFVKDAEVPTIDFRNGKVHIAIDEDVSIEQAFKIWQILKQQIA